MLEEVERQKNISTIVGVLTLFFQKAVAEFKLTAEDYADKLSQLGENSPRSSVKNVTSSQASRSSSRQAQAEGEPDKGKNDHAEGQGFSLKVSNMRWFVRFLQM